MELISPAERRVSDAAPGSAGPFGARRGNLVKIARCYVLQFDITDEDASILREVLEAKLVDLRREISHTDSPRFRDKLYQVEGMLQRLIGQLSPGGLPEEHRPPRRA
jgi:hypothetical protein